MARRIILYVFGVVLGVLVLQVTVFKDRDGFSSWFPSNRLKSQMQASHKLIAPTATCQLECINIPVSEVDRSLEFGEVLFDESGPRETPKRYVLSHVTRLEKHVKFEFEVAIDTIRMKQVIADEVTHCDCEE